MAALISSIRTRAGSQRGGFAASMGIAIRTTNARVCHPRLLLPACAGRALMTGGRAAAAEPAAPRVGLDGSACAGLAVAAAAAGGLYVAQCKDEGDGGAAYAHVLIGEVICREAAEMDPARSPEKAELRAGSRVRVIEQRAVGQRMRVCIEWEGGGRGWVSQRNARGSLLLTTTLPPAMVVAAVAAGVRIQMYSMGSCPWCVRAKELLEAKGWPAEATDVILIDSDKALARLAVGGTAIPPNTPANVPCVHVRACVCVYVMWVLVMMLCLWLLASLQPVQYSGLMP